MPGSSILGLLPVLASGYLFNLIFYPARFICVKADGQRLFFMSAVPGLLFAVMSFGAVSVARHQLPAENLLRQVGAAINTSIPVPHAAALLLTLICAPVAGLLLNLILVGINSATRRQEGTQTWVNNWLIDKLGSPLAKLLRKAAADQKLVLLNLKSRKIYCGRVLQVPQSIDGEGAQIELLPTFSAYRDKDTLELNPAMRTDYPVVLLWESMRYLEDRRAVLRELESLQAISPSEADSHQAAIASVRGEIEELEFVVSHAPPTFDIGDWVKVFPVAEIESASFFDAQAYEHWFVGQSSKPGSG